MRSGDIFIKFRAKKGGSRKYITSVEGVCVGEQMEDINHKDLAARIALEYPRQPIILYISLDAKPFRKADDIWQEEFDIVMTKEFNERERFNHEMQKSIIK